MWARAVELKAVFDALSQDEVYGIAVLAQIIKARVGLSLNRRTLPIPDGYLPYFGNLRCKQYPNELAQLLAFLYAQRDRIRSYLEIGVERCGTFYTVDPAGAGRSVCRRCEWRAASAVRRIAAGDGGNATRRSVSLHSRGPRLRG